MGLPARRASCPAEETRPAPARPGNTRPGDMLRANMRPVTRGAATYAPGNVRRGAMTPPPRRSTVEERWRFLRLAVLRPLLTVVALVVVYYVLPVDRHLDVSALILLITGIA